MDSDDDMGNGFLSLLYPKVGVLIPPQRLTSHTICFYQQLSSRVILTSCTNHLCLGNNDHSSKGRENHQHHARLTAIWMDSKGVTAKYMR